MKGTIPLSLQNFFSLFGMFELWRMVFLTRAFDSFLLALSRKRIDLKSMLGVYVVMGTGLLVAFFTLIGEIFWNRREKLKTLKKTKRFDCICCERNLKKRVIGLSLTNAKTHDCIVHSIEAVALSFMSVAQTSVLCKSTHKLNN